jgi:hypothetical protein
MLEYMYQTLEERNERMALDKIICFLYLFRFLPLNLAFLKRFASSLEGSESFATEGGAILTPMLAASISRSDG